MPIDRGGISKAAAGIASIYYTRRPGNSITWEDISPDYDRDFSFADVQAKLILPFSRRAQGLPPTVELPGLTLIAVSEHTDTFPVVAPGFRGIKGFTVGHTTTAGTLGFVTFGKNAFNNAIVAYANWLGDSQRIVEEITPQELPPLDLSIVLMNEDGQASSIFIKGLKIIDSSRQIGVQDVQLTEHYSFICMQASTMNKIQGYAKKSTEGYGYVLEDIPTTVDPHRARKEPPVR